MAFPCKPLIGLYILAFACLCSGTFLLLVSFDFLMLALYLCVCQSVCWLECASVEHWSAQLLTLHCLTFPFFALASCWSLCIRVCLLFWDLACLFHGLSLFAFVECAFHKWLQLLTLFPCILHVVLPLLCLITVS